MKALMFGAKETFIVVFSTMFLFVVTDGTIKSLQQRRAVAGMPSSVYRYELESAQSKDLTIVKYSYCEGEQIIVDQHSSLVNRDLSLLNKDSSSVSMDSSSASDDVAETSQALMISIFARTVKPNPCVRVTPYLLEEPFTVSGAMPMLVYLALENGLSLEN